MGFQRQFGQLYDRFDAFLARRTCGCLEKRVTRSNITCFAALEFVSAIMLVEIYTHRMSIAALLSPFLWILFELLCLFRVACGLLGMYAAFFRRVGRTKIYLVTLLCNTLASFLVAVPICRMSCHCFEPHELPAGLDEETNKVQCDILHPWSPDGYWHQPGVAIKREKKDPWKLFRVQKYGVTLKSVDSSLDEFGTYPICRDVNLTQSTLKLMASSPCSEETILDEQLDKLLKECFYDRMCGWVQVRKAPPPPGTDRNSVCNQVSVCGHSHGFDFNFDSTILCDGVCPSPTRVDGCLWDFELFLLKDMAEFALVQARSGSGETCKLEKVIGVVALGVLIILSFPMMLVIRVFVANRCGDHVESEVQFEVEDSSVWDMTTENSTRTSLEDEFVAGRLVEMSRMQSSDPERIDSRES
eukprot:TRINITY_DN46827_c0_g1_i1.p1 TRINITY_DN46827_c0_g1~~TRINITY_DN46827_c0_g1_i1.p1  ORF type:complete len:432 (+),score=84.30 TRINITY_DN46827_c0_g1_i1:52-1296(+)